MIWLARVVAFAITPVFVGALLLLAEPQRSISDVAAGLGLLLLCLTHVLYWWRPWPSRHCRAIVAAAVMVLTNFVLLNLVGLRQPPLGFTQPLLWLYPALIVGAVLRAPMAAVGVGLTALAAAAPMALRGEFVHPVDPAGPLGPSHSILLSSKPYATSAKQSLAITRQASTPSWPLPRLRSERPGSTSASKTRPSASIQRTRPPSHGRFARQ
jgi:hypothetical protein